MPKIVSVKVDYSKIEKLMEINGLSNIQLEHALGHTDGFLRHVKNRGTLTLTDYNLVKVLYGMDVKATEEPKEEKPAADYSKLIKAIEKNNNTEVIAKLDELIQSVNRLGNVNMQILEGLNKTNNHLLKPRAYTK